MEYIVDFKPYQNGNINIDQCARIEEAIKENKSISLNDAEEFLRNISYLVRRSINPNMDNFDLKCDLAQAILGHYFNKINCRYAPCATHNVITSQIDGHSFIVITLNVEGEDKSFLLDPTYIQFFHKDKCQRDNYFVSPMYPDKVLLTPDAGFFIKEEDKEPVDFLLRYGYIELTEEYARIYGDSFLNTKTGTNPQNLRYQSMPGSIYIKSFLKGKEPLSKTEKDLKESNQLLETFQSQKGEYGR